MECSQALSRPSNDIVMLVKLVGVRGKVVGPLL